MRSKIDELFLKNEKYNSHMKSIPGEDQKKFE